MALATGCIVFTVLSMVQISGVAGILSFFQTFPSRNENNEVVYEYRYSVDDPQSQVINDRWEQRIGEFVKGSYSLLEPSGKVRTVSYEVDGEQGFRAVVRTSFPALVLQSTQQFARSSQLFPNPAVNLRRSAPPPRAGQRQGLAPRSQPYNYHALAAQTTNTVEPQPSTRLQPPQQVFQGGGVRGRRANHPSRLRG